MKTILTISDSYYQTRVNTFFQSSYQTSLALWGNYSQSILHTFQDIKLYWHFQRVTAKQYCTLFQSLHQKILTFSESSFPIKLHLIYDTVDSGKKWLVDFNAGKTQLVSFEWSKNNGSKNGWVCSWGKIIF